MNSLNIKYIDSTSLILERSKTKALSEFSFLVIFVSLWYYALAKDDSGKLDFSGFLLEKLKGGIFDFMVLLVPLFVIGSILKSAKYIMFGDKFIFDKRDRILYRNDSKLSEFHCIKNLIVRRHTDDEGPDSYTISLALNTEERVLIERSFK